MRLVRFGGLALLALSVSFFGDRPGVPACLAAHGAKAVPGRPWPAQHEGQPATCDNFHSNSHKCECHRANQCPTPGETRSEDPKCQVYCRPDACKCISPCDT
jgi:hypothetical protein